MFRLSQKLHALKNVLRNLSRTDYSDIHNRVEEARKKMHSLQLKTIEFPISENILAEKNQEVLVNDLFQVEDSFWRQKSRINWLKGDRNSSFFHKVVKVKKFRDQIKSLHNSDGYLLLTQEEISKETVNFFTKLLGSDDHSYNLSNSTELQAFINFQSDSTLLASLNAPATAEEIKKTMMNFPANKAPGPDGYTTGFFKSTWKITGNSLIQAVQEFFRIGKLLKAINATWIMSKSFYNGTIQAYILL